VGPAAAPSRPAAPNDRSLFPGEAAMKKKVRYIIGTAGVLGAAPALGLLTPAVTAAAAAHTTPAGHSGKTVSLRPGTVLAAASSAPAAASSAASVATTSSPAATSSAASPNAERCIHKSTRKAHSGAGVNLFSGFASGEGFHGAACLRFVTGKLHHSQVALEMRVRTYKGTAEKQWPYVGGTINLIDSSTHFTKVINGIAGSGITKACEALVYSSNHAVAYGQICENV
jgi:hypothetical protein